jgi:hypothetical protein
MSSASDLQLLVIRPCGTEQFATLYFPAVKVDPVPAPVNQPECFPSSRLGSASSMVAALP